MTKQVLIIGGTGFIGYHVAKKCINLSWKIISLSLNPPRTLRKLKKVKYINFDTSKKNNFKYLKKFKFDYVINLGGYVEHKNEKKVKNGHYKSIKNIFDHFKDKHLKSFIHIGSSAEYGKIKAPHKESNYCKPVGIYGKYKYKATQFLLKKFKNNNFPVTIIRFYQVYGPKQDLNRFIPIVINSSLKNLEFKCSEATQSRDFLYIDDATNAIIKSIKSRKARGKIFNIGSGKAIVLKKIINLIFEKIGKGLPLFGKIPLRPGEPKIIFPEINHSKKLINWKPEINFNKGLIKTINYYKRIYN